MAANTRITELDFDDIKTNLKLFLKSQNEFSDYNFEGAGLNVLLDTLAYNTHYMAFYLNMLASEMFLDSAQVRSSVVSLAKHLGYTPYSTKSATAVVNMDITVTGSPTAVTIPRFTQFTATTSAGTFSFYNVNAITVLEDGGEYLATDIEIKEGVPLAFSYVFNSQDDDKRFVIPSTTIDTTTLKVTIRESLTDDSTEVFTLADDINTITDESKVYWLQETEGGRFEVLFGDGVVGKALSDGNVIILEYLSTSGELANGIGSNDSVLSPTFTLASTIDDIDDIDVTVTTPSFGGAPKESTASVKTLAPLSYEAQNRAVTTKDYVSTILSDYPSVESVYVWGGEENDPPQFGKVFISLKPFDGGIISDFEKQIIINDFLRRKSVLAITPEIVDPDYTYMEVTVSVVYNGDATTNSAGEVASLVTSTIVDYGDEELEKFDKKFRFSKLSKQIDETEDSILSNEMSIRMIKRLVPTIGSERKYTLNYANAIHHPHDGHISVVRSDGFTYFDPTVGQDVTSYLEDNGYGTLVLYNFAPGQKTVFNTNIGSVDYERGIVTLDTFNPVAISGDYVNIYVVPSRKDITTVQNHILLIDEDKVSVVASPDRTTNTIIVK